MATQGQSAVAGAVASDDHDGEYNGHESPTIDATAHPAAALDRALPVIVVHVALRRELRLAGPLVRRVQGGDHRSAATVAQHLGVVLQLLARHHETEDEHAFPLLAERATGQEEAMIELMQVQHGELERVLERVHATLPAWRRDASAAARDRLAEALEGLHVALVEHLDLEEQAVLPMAERLLTEQEWSAIGEHGEKGAKGRDKLLVFGMFVHGGDRAGIATMLAPAPVPVRLLLPRLALRTYRRHAKKVHGTPTP